MTSSEASKLFTQALKLVSSKSMQKWARDQRPEWVRLIRRGAGTIAGQPVFNCPEEQRALRLSTFIVCTAIGL